MAKKGKRKKTKKNELSAFDKRRYFVIAVISILLIISIIFTFDSLNEARKKTYFGLGSKGKYEDYPLSEISDENFFTDEFYFKGYDDDKYGYLRGIDVSEMQGEIDWAQVKEAGVEFAFVRVGYRTSDKGTLQADDYYKDNIKEAKKNGIKVGAYFFSQAVNVTEAIEEAAFTAKLLEGIELDYPVAFDMEEYEKFKDRIAWLSKEEITEISDAFCAVMENYGYDTYIYTNPSWANSKLDLSALTDRKLWLAHYSEYPEYHYKYEVWQYSNKGNVDGISVVCDLNIMFVEK